MVVAGVMNAGYLFPVILVISTTMVFRVKDKGGIRSWLLVSGVIFLMVFFVLPASAVQEPMGYYEVTSSPQGADVLVDGLFSGETPVIVPVRSFSGNGTSIRVMMQGFQTWEKTYVQNPQIGEVIQVQVVLVPVMVTGTLQVDSVPSGALVTVDNAKGQMTPWTYRDLPVGTHIVSLFLSGFEPFIRTVDILPGQTTRILGNMSTRSGSGSLSISSEPGGGAVYVDGVYAGITNLVVGNIAPGRHEVRITRPGFDDYREWVSLQNKESGSLKVTLVPNTLASGGSVVITTEPPGAAVYLDETFMGTTETGRPLSMTNVSSGTHQIYVSLKNYEDYAAQVIVGPGAMTPVSIRMNPSPMPQACGLLILNSDPSGADIVIDGQLKGVTPAAIESVCSGKHTYTLSIAGYKEYSAPIDLIPGQVLQVHTVLSPAPDTGGITPAGATPDQTTPLPSPALVILMIMGASILVRRRNSPP
ncbi:MAG TPA: PEGA domain-containing protein [Methanospirillum sp.]|nr:PEGA domain-containing protein [Methanospirillum sp.]